MKNLATSHIFQKQLKKLQAHHQREVVETLKKFLSALKSKSLSVGLGFKKINHDKYEIRVGLQLRIVMKLEGNTFVCHLIGNHESVRRYLKNYQNK